MSNKLQDDVMLTEEETISFGEKLKSTRENRGMSVQEAASRLHLSPRFLTMMENENLQQCTLPLIYLRGYLRSYARLLNIPEKDLAQVLEKLDPKPVLEDLQPVASDALSLSFPLETNFYYARIATGLIFLVLFTSITTWWYLHANAPSQTVIALKEPLSVSEPSTSLGEPETAKESAAPLNTPILETAAKNPEEIEQTKVPEAAIELNAKQPMALASAAAPLQNINNIIAKHISKPDENDDESSDEQE